MPTVATLEALDRAAATFEVADLPLDIEPPAREAARRSLADSGLLLLGEVHGVSQNPLVIRALLQAFDQLMTSTSTWSERDEAMAGPLLADTRAGTLVVAGNAHTPTRPTELGVPLGARLAAGRPGVKEIRIRYGAGRFYNLEPRRFPPDPKVRRGLLRLGLRHGSLLLDLPGPSEAIVPRRPLPAVPAPA